MLLVLPLCVRTAGVRRVRFLKISVHVSSEPTSWTSDVLHTECECSKEGGKMVKVEDEE